MSRATPLREAAVKRALVGAGHASATARRTAFDNTGSNRPWLDKVTRHAYKVTAEDVQAAKLVNTEDEIFELAVCAAFGQATRQLDAALRALDDAVKEP